MRLVRLFVLCECCFCICGKWCSVMGDVCGVWFFCNESFLGEGFLVKGYGINVLCFVWEIWVGVIWVLEKGKFSLELIDRVYKIMG